MPTNSQAQRYDMVMCQFCNYKNNPSIATQCLSCGEEFRDERLDIDFSNTSIKRFIMDVFHRNHANIRYSILERGCCLIEFTDWTNPMTPDYLKYNQIIELTRKGIYVYTCNPKYIMLASQKLMVRRGRDSDT